MYFLLCDTGDRGRLFYSLRATKTRAWVVSIEYGRMVGDKLRIEEFQCVLRGFNSMKIVGKRKTISKLCVTLETTIKTKLQLKFELQIQFSCTYHLDIHKILKTKISFWRYYF